MRNYVQPGRQITVTAPADLDSGEGVIIGSLFGVAMDAALNGASVDLLCEGVVDLPKVGNNVQDVFSVGTSVAWDVSLKSATTNNDSDGGLIGVAVASSGSGATTVRVRIDGFVR